MRDGYLVVIFTFKHLVDLERPNIWLMHSVAYRTEPKGRGFEKWKIGNMLAMNVLEPAQTMWAPQIIFAPMKGGTFRFSV